MEKSLDCSAVRYTCVWSDMWKGREWVSFAAIDLWTLSNLDLLVDISKELLGSFISVLNISRIIVQFDGKKWYEYCIIRNFCVNEMYPEFCESFRFWTSHEIKLFHRNWHYAEIWNSKNIFAVKVTLVYKLWEFHVAKISGFTMMSTTYNVVTHCEVAFIHWKMLKHWWQFSFFDAGVVQFSEFVTIMSETMSQTTEWGALKTEINGYVGIDTIQEQIRKKALKRGFDYNIMVVGKIKYTFRPAISLSTEVATS